MAKVKRPKLVQHIPEGPEPAFWVPEVVRELNFWHFEIDDSPSLLHGIRGDDRPQYRYTPPKKGCPFTVQELANAAAGECAEGRGLVLVREFTDNVCTFWAVFVANSRQVICVQSSDPQRAQPIDIAQRCRDWLASKQDRNTGGGCREPQGHGVAQDVGE